jgi:hypothetical protein
MPVNVNLRSFNGQYVSAEGGGGGPLVANRALASDWERFACIDPDGPPLTRDEPVVLQSYNGMFVCAENGGGGEIDVTRQFASTWETFKLEPADGPAAAGEITTGAKVALKTFNGKYVSAAGGGGQGVTADRDAIGQWETFTLEILGPAPLRGHKGPDTLAEGQFMESWATLSSSGRLDTKNNTSTTNRTYGFTGGAAVFLIDIAENILASSPIYKYGVDGTWAPGLPSSRSVPQVDTFTPEQFNSTVKLEILHVLTPTNRLKADIDQGAAIGKSVFEIIDLFRKNPK